jgi:hypothetical protein
MIDLLNPYKWLLLLALCGALGVGYVAWAKHQQGIGEDRATARYEAALTKQKAEAAALLSSETAKVQAAEAAMLKFHFENELKDRTNEKAISLLADKLHRATGNSGRLRDPNATTGCGQGGGGAQGQDTASSGDSAADGALPGGLLSEQLTGLLTERTKQADTINNAYRACRADAYEIRAELSK